MDGSSGVANGCVNVRDDGTGRAHIWINFTVMFLLPLLVSFVKNGEFSTVAAQFVYNLDQKEWIRAVDNCGQSPADGKLIVISGACRAYQKKF